MLFELKLKNFTGPLKFVRFILNIFYVENLTNLRKTKSGYNFGFVLAMILL